MLITHVSVFEKDRFYSATLQTEKDRIVRLFTTDESLPEEETKDGHNCYLFPAPVDLHIHGFGGYGAETGELLELSHALAKQGVGAFAPTFYSAPVDILCKQLKNAASLIHKEKGAKIIGFHVEGPFLSPLKKGVMRAEDTALPSVQIMEQLYQAAGGHLFSITLAPELPQSDAVIDWCLQRNILVQLGHTDATFAQMQYAKQAGARHITHLGNAMRGLHHRELGALGAGLADNDFSCEIIADGVHLVPDFIRFLHRVKPIDKIVLVTDALRPTGQPRPPFVANGDEVVLKDNVWKRKTDDVTAGSALTMLKGMQNVTAWGFSHAEAVVCGVVNPARLADISVSTLPLLLTDGNFNLLHVFPPNRLPLCRC